MQFLEAMKAAGKDTSGLTLKVSRPDGPAFLVGRLGQVFLQKSDCLYLCDLLDLDDWDVDTVPDRETK